MVRLDNIGKRFGELMVIHDLSFDFEKGKKYALIGPNNCGKTTLLYLIAGFYRQSSGNIFFQDGVSKNLKNVTVHSRSHLGIGLTFQDPRGFVDFSVKDNLAISMMDRGSDSLLGSGKYPLKDDDNESIDSLLRRGGLVSSKFDKLSFLSYGQRKVMDFLCLLARNCKLFLLDEPFAGIDQVSADILTQLILNEAINNDKTILIVSHEIPLVSEIVDEIILMEEGNLIVHGEPKKILASEVFKRVYLS